MIISQVASVVLTIIKGYNLKWVEYGKKKHCVSKFIEIISIDKSSNDLFLMVKKSCGNIIKHAFADPR